MRSSHLVLLVAVLVRLTPTSAAAVSAPHEKAKRLVVLENDRCRLELDAGTGGIASLQPGPASLKGPWFEVVEEDRTGLAGWETWEHGEENVFRGGPADVTCAQREGTARVDITWERPNGLSIRGEAELRPEWVGPRFRLTVSNRTGAALVDTLRMPVLRGIVLGDPSDDWFTWPHTLGARFRAEGFAPGQQVEEPYPGFLTMQWLDLFDSSRGVYVACLDDYGYSKRLFIGRDDDGRSLMGISFIGCWIAEAGDQWATPWVSLAAHEGDWRVGANLYRTWAEPRFGPLDVPERVREMPTAQCWLAHHARDADVGKLFEIQQQAPIHASYLMKSLNTSIPEGWDGFRGSAVDLQDAFNRIRELGGSPALFTFDRAPLMGRPNYADHVGRWTFQQRDRSFLEGFRDTMPAPFDADLRGARVGEAARWVQAFGLDEIHFDTAVYRAAEASYHPGTPQRPNEVPHYFKDLYRAIRDAGRKLNPDFLLRAEHGPDFFYPEFLTSTAHVFVTSNLVAGHKHPDDAQLMPILFRTTLPRHAALQMPSMSDSDFWTYGYGMGHGFHGGGPSWCFNPGVREAESPPGELLHRYRFYDGDWRRYYDFRVGFEEAVVDAERSDVVAEARIDGDWRTCAFPGPVIAVTHCGGGREVTLGQWYHLSRTKHFGQRFVGEARLEPRPIRLRVPTRLQRPRVRLFGEWGEVEAEPTVVADSVEVDIPDPTCFALEVSTGPAVTLATEELAHPGATTHLSITVEQPEPAAGTVTVRLPAGWPGVGPLNVPGKARFSTRLPIGVPEGVFGRNYPVKTILRVGDLRRTSATHLRVMEPMAVLFDFDAAGSQGGSRTHCVDPGQRARLTVTCVNNTPGEAAVEVLVRGRQLTGRVADRVAGIAARELGNRDSPLHRWTEGKGAPPPNALVSPFDFDCTGVPDEPVHIEVRMDRRAVFSTDAFPRTRVMDLNGEWRVAFMPKSRARVGGAERLDNLDTEAVTPDVWDGGWERHSTPIRFDKQVRQDSSWAVYRRLVYLPPEWRGADVCLRLSHMGAPWGQGGTLNLVYVNGWPCGRIGTAGECSLTSFLVFGGWNLLAIGSMSPNSLVDPYLFVRDAPAPDRIRPLPPAERPRGAFLLLGQRPTGQGLSLGFVKGVPEGDCRRTDVAKGGENVFIYFAIADAFLREPKGLVEIEVEYQDRGTGTFGLDYDSTDEAAPIKGAFKAAPPAQRTDTGQWKTHVFVLPDARLANHQHQGADFRLAAGGNDDLRLRRVEVRRADQ